MMCGGRNKFSKTKRQSLVALLLLTSCTNNQIDRGIDWSSINWGACQIGCDEDGQPIREDRK
jgi:hypothetical protein